MSENFKHSFWTDYHDSLGLSVYNCGFQKCDPCHSWGPAVRNHFLLHFVASGKGKFTISDREYNLSAGDGFVTFPNEMAYYAADEKEPWEYCWVGFNGVDAMRLMSAAGFNLNRCFHCDDINSVKDMITEIYNANGSKLSDEVYMTGCIYKFMSFLININGNEVSLYQGGIDYVKAAIKYIEHNYSRQISIVDIAEAAGISRSHLYRMFMKQLNITPNEYLIKYRINIACELLKGQNINVSETAYSTGFTDPLYFSRVFKSIKGVSPSKYVSTLLKSD